MSRYGSSRADARSDWRRQWRGRWPEGQPAPEAGFSQGIEARVSDQAFWLDESSPLSLKPLDQLFSSGLICFANPRSAASPLIISPLMKKVGVDAFSTSARVFLVGSDLVEQRLILQAVLDLLPA